MILACRACGVSEVTQSGCPLSWLASRSPFAGWVVFFLLNSVCFLPICSFPQEIRQLQQKQAGYIREISDLQETIEWKDKKIGVGVLGL